MGTNQKALILIGLPGVNFGASHVAEIPMGAKQGVTQNVTFCTRDKRRLFPGAMERYRAQGAQSVIAEGSESSVTTGPAIRTSLTTHCLLNPEGIRPTQRAPRGAHRAGPGCAQQSPAPPAPRAAPRPERGLSEPGAALPAAGTYQGRMVLRCSWAGSCRAAGPPTRRAGGQRGLLPRGHSGGRPLSPEAHRHLPETEPTHRERRGRRRPLGAALLRCSAAGCPGSARGGASRCRSSRSPGRGRPRRRGGFAHRTRLRELRNKEAADWLGARCEHSDWPRGVAGPRWRRSGGSRACRGGPVPFAIQKIAACPRGAAPVAMASGPGAATLKKCLEVLRDARNDSEQLAALLLVRLRHRRARASARRSREHRRP